MIGVTIGIGEDYLFNANEAAKRFTRYTGLNTVVMTEQHLEDVMHYNIFKAARNFSDKIFFLKFFLFNFFSDDVVYFDADYCVVDHWNPMNVFDGRFTAVRDRTHGLFERDVICCDIQKYFNAGFFIASYKHHRRFFDRCVKVGADVPFKFGDQCILNKVAQDSSLPVKYLDKRYNCLDYAGAMVDSDVKSIHNGFIYSHYKEGTEVKPSKKYKWNLVEMAGVAGLVTLIFEDKMQKSVYLHPDGITNEGHIWFITEDHEFYICEHYVDRPRRVIHVYPQ